MLHEQRSFRAILRHTTGKSRENEKLPMDRHGGSNTNPRKVSRRPLMSDRQAVEHHWFDNNSRMPVRAIATGRGGVECVA